MSILKWIWSVLKRLGAWLVFSSSNPNKVALSAKGGLTLVATLVTMAAGFANVQLPSEGLTEVIDAIIAFIQGSLLWISSAVTAWGVLRKLWTSISGDNRVINEHPAFNG